MCSEAAVPDVSKVAFNVEFVEVIDFFEEEELILIFFDGFKVVGLSSSESSESESFLSGFRKFLDALRFLNMPKKVTMNYSS